MTVITQKAPSERAVWVKFVVVLLILMIAAEYSIWLLEKANRSSTPPRTQTVTPPGSSGAVAVSEAGLSTLASLGRSIYWAGPKSGFTYELTQRPDGRVYLRYLPPGTPVGSPQSFLTVASYPVVNAYQVTRSIAQQAGSVKVAAPTGAIAFYRSDLPTNVYLAFKGSDYQIEVFDPTSGEALNLVTSGTIQPVAGDSGGATLPRTAAVAIQPAQLAGLATRLGRPLYWAGARPRTTYELTQTPDGRVYVRYLPVGTKVGSQEPFLTVGTYPVPNAYATTKSASQQKDSIPIPIAGGVAFYTAAKPTSVYIAFPGVDEQIEVFDPSAARLHAEITRRLVRAVH
jgi:hypothetical protein